MDLTNGIQISEHSQRFISAKMLKNCYIMNTILKHVLVNSIDFTGKRAVGGTWSGKHSHML